MKFAKSLENLGYVNHCKNCNYFIEIKKQKVSNWHWQNQQNQESIKL